MRQNLVQAKFSNYFCICDLEQVVPQNTLRRLLPLNIWLSNFALEMPFLVELECNRLLGNLNYLLLVWDMDA